MRRELRKIKIDYLWRKVRNFSDLQIGLYMYIIRNVKYKDVDFRVCILIFFIIKNNLTEYLSKGMEES